MPVQTSLFMRARAALCCLVLCCLAGEATALEEGKPAPGFQVQLLDGRSLGAADIRGKVVILNFWATWCEACRKEMPVLDNYYLQHRQQGLVVIAISLDDRHDEAQVRHVMESYHFPAALQRNSDYRDYGRIRFMPVSFLIDRQGVLQKNGAAQPWMIDETSLERLVTPLLAN